jgi:hypothetical protein
VDYIFAIRGSCAGRSRRAIADATGITRLGHFFILLELLADCDDYQLLSGATRNWPTSTTSTAPTAPWIIFSPTPGS